MGTPRIAARCAAERWRVISMNNCEIVENVACGVSFQYCRTHKVEPKDCPGNKMTEPTAEPDPMAGIRENLQKDFQKREFKVGDKVRILDAGVHKHLNGQVCTVTQIGSAWPEYPYITDARSNNTFICFGTDHLEHV